MTVLVDEAIWPWRGRRWAHLVSDRELDELHDLAHGIGLPFLSFQGDHYDVHEELRGRAIDRGAVPTPARQLVRSLREAGLRHKASLAPWVWQGEAASTSRTITEALDDARLTAEEDRDRCAAALVGLGTDGRIRVAHREGLHVVVASVHIERDIPTGLERLSPTLAIHRAVGERGSFVEVSHSVEA